MAIFDIQNHPWVFVFGVLGNLISFCVFLSPIPTFLHIFKKKSTENFQSVPYLVGLFSCMLWIYYAFLKGNDTYLLITINSFGCFIEVVYISIFFAYASRQAKILTAKFLLSLNVGLFLFIFLLTFFLAKGANRVTVLGWVCVAFSAIVFAAPLSVIRMVIRTKSVEFMPFFLSLFLTLSAVVWFGYGLVLKDHFIYCPNILGFLFGVVQMTLYIYFKYVKIPLIGEAQNGDIIIDVVKLHPIETELTENGNELVIDEQKHEKTNPNGNETRMEVNNE